MPNAELVALDTMNLWIEHTRDSLSANDQRRGCRDHQRCRSAAVDWNSESDQGRARDSVWGPKALIIKRGEYGAALFTPESYFAIPAYPLESVFDPTGAGDTFAGGFMGYLSSQETLDEARCDAR